MNCIDTHIHVWNFERCRYSWLDGNTTILNRTFTIEELTPQLPNAHVTEGVLVQAANTEEETAYMLEVADANDWIKGVVGWMPLQNPKAVEKIIAEGYATHLKFKGVRHLIHDEPDADWLLQPAAMESMQLLADADIPYDVVGVLPAHLKTVLKLLDKVEGIQLVLDHLNQPPISTGEKFGEWGELIKEVAIHPAVYAKISGLGTTTGKGDAWCKEDIKPYIAFALQHFGAERCFCGGDWPVSLLAGSYNHAWNVYRQTIHSLVNEDDAEKVFYSNAKRFYRL